MEVCFSFRKQYRSYQALTTIMMRCDVVSGYLYGQPMILLQN